MSVTNYSMIVIGAGICGLTIARNHPHLSSLILEKSRGLGGRIATRRATPIEDELVFDHGAQFFKHSSKEPFYWHSFLEEEAVLHDWFSAGGIQYYCAHPGMTQIAKSLAKGLNLSLNEKVVAIQDEGNQLRVKTETGKSFGCQQLVVTSPLPQALELLSCSGIPYPGELTQVQYAKALIGLFQIARPLNIKFQEINQFGIYSLSGQASKGLCSKEALVVCMDSDFSASNFDLSDEQILALIERSLFEIKDQIEDFQLGPKDILFSSLKKWKYSHPKTMVPSKSLNQTLLDGRVILAGDAFGGGSVHGAVRSALSVQLGQFSQGSIPKK